VIAFSEERIRDLFSRINKGGTAGSALVLLRMSAFCLQDAMEENALRKGGKIT